MTPLNSKMARLSRRTPEKPARQRLPSLHSGRSGSFRLWDHNPPASKLRYGNRVNCPRANLALLPLCLLPKKPVEDTERSRSCLCVKYCARLRYTGQIPAATDMGRQGDCQRRLKLLQGEGTRSNARAFQGAGMEKAQGQGACWGKSKLDQYRGTLELRP